VELRSYLTILRRRWRVIAITAAVTLGIGVIGTLLIAPVYIASTTLRVSTAANRSIESVSYDSIMYATRLMNTYSKIATSEQVLEELRGRLGLRLPPQVKVDVPANSELMQISVENQDPAVAAAAANALAEILVANISHVEASAAKSTREALGNQLVQLQAELQQASAAQSPDGTESATMRRSLELKQQQYARVSDQYARAQLAETVRPDSVDVLEPAKPPETPARPRMTLNVAIAVVIGLVGGTGMAFLVQNLDTRLYTTRHIEDVVDLSILTSVPVAHLSPRSALFQPNSPEQEALRRVCTAFFHPRHPAPPRKILVTSAVPEEGKSTVVANLAVVFARTGRTVAVVDCDLRLPAQHRMFDMPNRIGLSSYLNGQATLDRAAQWSHIPGLEVITSGPLPPNPGELVGSWELANCLDELVARRDVVLLDSPSLLAVADAQALAPLVDRVVLVVGRGQASAEAVRTAREQLIGARARSICVVVNRAEPEDGSYTYYSRASGRA
jgi:polysaccharide biosynthesis transport protein